MFTRRALLAAPLLAEPSLTAPLHAAAALERLEAGNRRFAASMAEHPDQSEALRMNLSHSQHPFAVVLTCSDSRVAPELIFDQGLGDLFVIRVAGNILDDAVIGSVEYAAAHLEAPLVYVLGHQRCGAVQAALGAQPEAHIRNIAAAIRPAVERARSLGGDLLDHAVRENVKLVAARLAASQPVLAKRVASQKLKIVGGYYHLSTGVASRIA